jgi:rhodanese-related sulfurtransferase
MNHRSIDTLQPAAVKKMLDDGQLLLVDVREPAEFSVERIAGAVLYPLSTFDAAALPPNWTRRVVFYCGSGKRSLAAAEKRVAHTGERAAHMAGGITAWKSAGLPLVTLVAADSR